MVISNQIEKPHPEMCDGVFLFDDDLGWAGIGKMVEFVL